MVAFVLTLINHFIVVVKKLTSLIEKLNVGQSSQPTSAPAKVAAPARAKPKATPAQDDDDDVDLFGSDDEVDEEAEKLKQERVAAYTAKKSKSMFFLDNFKMLHIIYVILILIFFQNLLWLPSPVSFLT